MKVKIISIAVLVAMLFGFAAMPVSTVAAQVVNPFQDIPISGVVPGIDGTFEGTLDIVRFARQGGDIVAIGTLTGEILGPAGELIGTVTNFPVTLPVDLQEGGSCDILFLQLGPLDLELLGLVVELDQVTLEITAEQGPGNLLGNLLCVITGLLDAPATPVVTLVRLLNQILGILG